MVDVIQNRELIALTDALRGGLLNPQQTDLVRALREGLGLLEAKSMEVVKVQNEVAVQFHYPLFKRRAELPRSVRLFDWDKDNYLQSGLGIHSKQPVLVNCLYASSGVCQSGF